MEIGDLEKRIDYAERLIDGVQAMVEKHCVIVDGEQCIPADWVDADLLCAVVKEDFLPILKKKPLDREIKRLDE